ncbi:MAG TPA: tetratricopeptide repeat protein [Saprospiraceae bacterium]|nr:tetratricopeptide repeat protein [Saprospiraceae bacterium]HNT20675.1 tetratricopeptide repeat protein [Saprospiraceae bacterium]
MKRCVQIHPFWFCLSFILFFSCKEKNKIPSLESIGLINLKRGEVTWCGPPDGRFGTVEFETSCSVGGGKDFNLAMALLHSFEYDEAEKVFAKIIDQSPDCAMAYWGVAMSNYHPLWAPPSEAELEKGSRALAVARGLERIPRRESDYLEALSLFYEDWQNTDHRTRSMRFEKAMEKLYYTWPDDIEAAIYYSLALVAAADPADKTFTRQKKAHSILTSLYPNEPDHPGIVHYIIHSCDYPELAELALPAARKYMSIAPSSAHALHMPSHIFTRLGLWDECIQSNLVSAASAKCYAENAGLKGHWDEELHAMDYLVYAYLQKGENDLARQQLEYLNTIHEVSPTNFKVAYAFAAIPSRFVLENRLWNEAATLQLPKINFLWQDYPWQTAIVHFTRLLGNVHLGHLDSARLELAALEKIYDALMAKKETYNANQVLIQINSAKAWIQLQEGKNSEALRLMDMAAQMEDNTEKHPVTPGEVIPARELLGDMLLQVNQPGKALEAYEINLKRHPNRFNSLYGAGLAAAKSNNPEKAQSFYDLLTSVANPNRSERPELEKARSFLKRSDIK